MIPAALEMAWLCTAFAWAIAGMAVASWSRRPLWLGAVAGGLLPVLGCLLFAGWAARRRSQLPSAAAAQPAQPIQNSAPASGFPALPVLPGSAWTAAPASEQWPTVASRAWPASVEPSFPTFPVTGSPVGLAPERATRLPVGTPRTLFASAAAVLAAGLTVTLFISNWVTVTATASVSASLGAWDIGLGPMMLLTVVEFALLAAVGWRWSTRWLGVLAVFASTWWLLLWWIALQVTGGLRRFARQGRDLPELRRAGVHAGGVWQLVLGLALGMLIWGLAYLISLHRGQLARR